jgi:DNA-binding HxlR family transcriptional regulator
MSSNKQPPGNRPPMGDLQYNVYAERCPTRQALDRIADKWTALIVGLLAERPHRFGELQRSIEGISHKVLTSSLRSLERDGLVARRVLEGKPAPVEYSLTAVGETLIEPLAAIRSWAEMHIEEILRARASGAADYPDENSAGDRPATPGRRAS